MRKFSRVVISSVILLVTSAGIVHAENSSNSANTLRKIDRMEYKADVKQTRIATREAILEDKAAMREAISAKRAQYKQQLQTIKDTRKQGIVDKIDGKISTFNSTQTTKWNEDLNRLQNVLNKISTEASTLQGTTGGTSPLDRAITNASTAITTAQAAVAAQAAKEYVINITSETVLRSNVGSTVSQFRLDLNKTRQTVQAAQLAVVKAAVELRKVKGDTMNKATNSAEVTIQ